MRRPTADFDNTFVILAYVLNGFSCLFERLPKIVFLIEIEEL